ncbi:MAG TPA: hypothetical protein PKV67_16590 [Hyphomonas sp.]|nr:hypothetical protein [Hyphomonas sp.]HRK67516.1 hypothetical protein [Hyphomonas sp.]
MAADGDGFPGSLAGRLSPALAEPLPDARAAHRAAFGFDFAFPGWSARRIFPAVQRHGAAPIFAVAGIVALYGTGLGRPAAALAEEP